ncbi:hypothetical protein [Devosia sp. 2618]|uniref:hypothetical protein n=1 Tax=Devosia sp. 2618 TaxID=3156454 RepID=UPI003398F36E
MALDHGALNVPLNKRGNIDAQIDSYKAQVAKDAKARRKQAAVERAALKAEALALFGAVTLDRLAQLAERANQTPAAVRDYLRSQCHWQPALVIKILSQAA